MARFLASCGANQNVEFAFYGLRPAVTGLIAAATFEVFKLTILRPDAFGQTGGLSRLFDWGALVLFAVVFVALMKTRLHPALFIALGAAAGVLFDL